MPPGSRLRAALGIAAAQLRFDTSRSVLTVIGIVVAVLSMTLLASVGLGVMATGEEKFQNAGRDLWMTGGPVRLGPGLSEGSIYDAHTVSDDIEARDDVSTAVPMAFQTVYVSRTGEDFQTMLGVGAPARGPSVSVSEGSGFSSRDVHYADGSYDGEMTHEVVIDRRTAAMFDVGVGDTIYIGGTLAAARNNEFTVVGISPTFSRFLGAPTVTLHLSELQEVTGTAGIDQASLITIATKDEADPAAVKADLESQYPEYVIRTNQQQLRSMLEQQALVLAAGVSLVVLAIVAGLVLTANLLLSYVYQQRATLAALKALGWRTRTIALMIGTQGLLLGVVGGLLGVGLTKPVAAVLDHLAASVVGFENLVRTPDIVLLAGFGIAVVISLLSVGSATVLIARISPLEHLE